MNRRGFLLGLGGSLIAAPAVVRAASLMPVGDFSQPALVQLVNQINNDKLRMFERFHVKGYAVVAINPSPRPIADESV